MRLVHITHVDNVWSIMRWGLDPQLAQSPRGIWLATEAAEETARCHVLKNHGWREEDVVTLRVLVSHVEVYRHADTPYYVAPRGVTPGRISYVV